jgi:primosomal protein N' (replication factor Y) (superfamily II helicase)
VAGRSGRGSQPGQVILQTYTPEHPVIASVVTQDYGAFARDELEIRKVLGYPPMGRLILIKLSSPDAIAVQTGAERVAAVLRDWLRSISAEAQVLGPTPAVVLRVAQRYRWQVMVKGGDLGSSMIVELPLGTLRSAIGPTVSLTVDVDPLNLM